MAQNDSDKQQSARLDEPVPLDAANDESEGSDDTEGHGLLMDVNTARGIARGRAADIEREARDRQRAKEARPNRNKD